MKHIGTCAACQQAYIRSRPLRGTTCSPICAGQLYRRKREVRLCAECNQSFERIPSSPVKHCSLRCFNSRTTRKPDMIRICERCNISFKRLPGHKKQRFCSKRCGRLKPFKPPEYRVCRFCKITFFPSHGLQLYCSRACGSRIRPAGRKRHKKALLAIARNCHRCGWATEGRILELHHMDRNRRNNKQDNLALLCPNCHALDHFHAHDGRFTLFSST